MATYRFWRTDGQLHNAGPGIRILHDDVGHNLQPGDDPWDIQQVAFPNDFSTATRDNLNYIYLTATGQTLLNFLAGHPQAPTIAPAVAGNSIQILSRAHMKAAASELHGNQPGQATRAAVLRMINNQPFILGSHMLARAVNTTARWTLEARPGHLNLTQMSYSQIFFGGHTTSYLQQLRDRAYRSAFGWDSNEGYGENQVYVSTERGQRTGSVISRDEMQAWLIGGTLPGRITGNPAQLHHVINVCIASLYPHDLSGPGAGGAIGWRHQANYTLNQRRPPAIGLAHELIHCYHALQGNNPGVIDADPTVVLFEYRCVGLGAFANAPVTENGLRTEWGGIVNQIPVNDANNRRVPGQRVSYL